MPLIERKILLERFRGMIAHKEPIIGDGSIERLPVETALTEKVCAFRRIAF